MQFDIRIVLEVQLVTQTKEAGGGTRTNAFPAAAHIRLLYDEDSPPDMRGRWRVFGRGDPRLPGAHGNWLRWRRRDDSLSQNIVLSDEHGADWAILENFPLMPSTQTRRNNCWVFHLRSGPNPLTHDGRYTGDWYIDQFSSRNLTQDDPMAGVLDRLLKQSTFDTGFRYDNSDSSGLSGGVGVGGGYMRGHLWLRRKEPSDLRKWKFFFRVIGVGAAAGIGVTASTTDMKSDAVTEVRAGPAARSHDFDDYFGEGGDSFFAVVDVGVDASAGVGPAGAGGGGSTTTYLWLNGLPEMGETLDVTRCRALLQTWSSHGGAGGAPTKPVTAFAGALIYLGRIWSHFDPGGVL